MPNIEVIVCEYLPRLLFRFLLWLCIYLYLSLSLFLFLSVTHARIYIYIYIYIHTHTHRFLSYTLYVVKISKSNSYPNFGITDQLFDTKWSMKLLSCSIKRDQLDVTSFIISLFNAQHVSDVNTSILRSLRLICWVISLVVLLWFDVCWCYGVVWLGWCGIRMQAESVSSIPRLKTLRLTLTLLH